MIIPNETAKWFVYRDDEGWLVCNSCNQFIIEIPKYDNMTVRDIAHEIDKHITEQHS